MIDLTDGNVTGIEINNNPLKNGIMKEDVYFDIQ